MQNTRITVSGLVEWRRLGLSDSELIQRVTGLEPDDLAAAWAYAEQHPDEIDPAVTDAAA